MISITRLSKLAEAGSGQDDDAVVALFESYQSSQNADSAFQELMGAVCAIALHRPHLLERLLPKAIDPAVSMGVKTVEELWPYAEFCALRALETRKPAVPDFTEETAAFLHGGLRQEEALVSRLLQECLKERLEE